MLIDSSPSSDSTQTLTSEEFACLQGCGNYSQYHLMRKCFEANQCAFCNLDRARNQVLWEDESFMLWKVPAGIGKKRPLECHILIVPKRHVRFVADLMDEEAISLIVANRFARDNLGYTGGLNHAREGDMRNNAGTVPHLHFNLFQPNGTGEVQVPVYKDLADRQKNSARARRFSTLYGQGVSPEQFNAMIADQRIDKEGRMIGWGEFPT